ncbi:hypothetical protein [Ktedonobacter sp. SOSP1-52]|nr:hypothetical protein [Ktedonobacter sp. SOSP1-52]
MTHQEHHSFTQSLTAAALQQITSANLDYVLAFSPDAFWWWIRQEPFLR